MIAVLERDAQAGRSGLAGGLLRRASMLAKIGIAVLLALTPVTAILVLGWLVRIMRRETIVELVRRHRGIGRGDAIAAVANSENFAHQRRFPGWWSGLWETVQSAMKAILAVGLLTLPFGLLLLLSWWAGWENSFNKGYEQAWVGPTIALFGALTAIILLSHAPMAFAVFAAEGKLIAIFDVRRLRRLIRAVRWRYVWLTFSMVILSAPLFLAQILPTFIEQINPQLVGADAETVKKFANGWHLLATIYLVVAALILRRWAARLYARAALAIGREAGELVAAVGDDLKIDLTEKTGARRTRLGLILSTVLTSAAWVGFLVMLYIAQFANHAWWNWVNHPLLALPWIFRPM